MKKILSAAIIMIMAFAATASANFVDGYAEELMLDEPTSFADIALDHPNKRAINQSYQFGIIEGYEDGTFGPDRPINRAELIKVMVIRYFDKNGIGPDVSLYHDCFKDVNQQWYAPYICYAYEQEWVEGYEDGTFKPANPVNRVEALKIILEIGLPSSEWPDPTDQDSAVELPVDIETGQWYEDYARMAIVKDLVDGQHVTQDSQGRDYYYPGDNMTRKEVVEMLWRIFIWVVERDTYGQAIAEIGCVQVANPEMENYTVFEVYGFDQADTDRVIEKYFYDTVGDSKIEYYAAEKCGPGVEYDNSIFE